MLLATLFSPCGRAVEEGAGVDDLEDDFAGGVVRFWEFSDDAIYDDFVVVFEAAAGGVADEFAGHVGGEFVASEHEKGFQFLRG